MCFNRLLSMQLLLERASNMQACAKLRQTLVVSKEM